MLWLKLMNELSLAYNNVTVWMITTERFLLNNKQFHQYVNFTLKWYLPY